MASQTVNQKRHLQSEGLFGSIITRRSFPNSLCGLRMEWALCFMLHFNCVCFFSIFSVHYSSECNSNRDSVLSYTSVRSNSSYLGSDEMGSGKEMKAKANFLVLHVLPVQYLVVPKNAFCACDVYLEKTSHWNIFFIYSDTFSIVWLCSQAHCILSETMIISEPTQEKKCHRPNIQHHNQVNSAQIT